MLEIIVSVDGVVPLRHVELHELESPSYGSLVPPYEYLFLRSGDEGSVHGEIEADSGTEISQCDFGLMSDVVPLVRTFLPNPLKDTLSRRRQDVLLSVCLC